MNIKNPETGKLTRLGGFLTLLPFLIAITLVVMILPKGGATYKYQYEIGKPWQYDLLTATYDFPIYKTQEQLQNERDEILNRHIPYFDFDSEVMNAKLQNLTKLADANDALTIYIDDRPTRIHLRPYAEYLIEQLSIIYPQGIMSDAEYRECAGKNTPYIVVTENNLSRNKGLDDVYSATRAKETLINNLPKDLIPVALNHIGLDNFVTPNLDYNLNLTTKVKTEDLNSLSTTSGMVQAGERIIDTGELVTAQKYNILDSMRKASELMEETTLRQRTTMLVGEILLVSALFLLFYIYLLVFRFNSLCNIRFVVMTLSLMVIFLAVTAIISKLGRGFMFYGIPYALLPTIVSTFGEDRIDTRTGLFAHIITTLLASLMVPIPFTFLILQIPIGMVTINCIKDFSQRSQFVRTAFIIFLSYCVLYVGYVLIGYNDLTVIDGNMFLALFANCLLLMMAYPLIFIIEKVFKFTSNVTLLELTNTNTPLLRELSVKAPGTFQHSMSVANLASDLAEAVGANALLARTGGLYHDIGKMANAAFFTENQKGVNPHSKISPEQSAQIIIKHVTDGVAMAKQSGLPEKLIGFIRTHHGKGLVKYFYTTWVNDHDGATPDPAIFTYPGPNPSTREQGILMICDAVEAASRSLPEYTDETINNLVEKIVNSIVTDGYLDDVPLTLQNINKIKSILKDRLHSTYHTRISYPELKKQGDDKTAEKDATEELLTAMGEAEAEEARLRAEEEAAKAAEKAKEEEKAKESDNSSEKEEKPGQTEKTSQSDAKAETSGKTDKPKKEVKTVKSEKPEKEDKSDKNKEDS